MPCSIKFNVQSLRTGFQHLLLRTASRTDPITRALSVLIMAKSHVEYVDPKVLSQYLSLLFIGFLVGNSMRNFVNALFRLFFAVGGGGRGLPASIHSFVRVCVLYSRCLKRF